MYCVQSTDKLGKLPPINHFVEIYGKAHPRLLIYLSNSFQERYTSKLIQRQVETPRKALENVE